MLDKATGMGFIIRELDKYSTIANKRFDLVKLPIKNFKIL